MVKRNNYGKKDSEKEIIKNLETTLQEELFALLVSENPGNYIKDYEQE